MRRCLVLLTLACSAGTVWAQAGDPLQSAGCRHALEALEAQEAATLDRRETALARLEPLRRRAATACLGARIDGARPAAPPRAAQPPISVPPVTIAPPPRVPVPGAVGPAAPTWKELEPPTTVIGCDATTCWASDGSRLQRAGANLIGPRGLCSLKGTVLVCP
jgi:hypothetical protein